MIDHEIKIDLGEDNENQDILNDLKKTKRWWLEWRIFKKLDCY